MGAQWREELVAFFETRSEDILRGPITLEKLCYVSGRDSRLWDPDLYEDLLASLRDQLDLEPTHSLLEVGCAAGFLAKGLAGLVDSYTGVDLSAKALKAAQSLGLANCAFRPGDGTRLPFADNSFDRVLCYDVFTNLPEMSYAARIVAEMVRVVKPGGKALVGSLADKETEAQFAAVVTEVGARLEAEKGPVLSPPHHESWFKRLSSRLVPRRDALVPRIICYYFSKADMRSIGDSLGAPCDIRDIHEANPYRGYRFNAIYRKSP